MDTIDDCIKHYTNNWDLLLVANRRPEGKQFRTEGKSTALETAIFV
jgi:hypothetical protein